ncbi:MULTISPECIES: ABC transporter permease [Mycobacterium]|uniref:Permease n=1 Tax=Mycobacterium kiyosense TaxID=2871094 RepID=A0A9P3V0I7_9MYCO|nr:MULTISPECIES: FtsX-like permease family protein [Mycobacterium]BDB40251.1 permease [Mycobacterium kiyosense]BDE12074.1 permease [Mycobacterium sp. 20KCMC460]GLB83710.1 permease [Mycobacterium kiyosense]GLB88772.1 permease [Mycobacterium kiyosense]GLB96369.1 permease [Mycobacterium kiyosense]
MIASAAVRFKLLNLRYAVAHWKRSLSCVAAVMIASALLVAIAGIYSSLTKSVATMSEDLYGKAAFEVTGAADSGMPDSLVAQLRAVDGVAAAEPIVKATVNTPRSGTTLLGVGPDIRVLDNRVGNELVQQADQDKSHGSLADGAIAGPGLGTAPGGQVEVNGVRVNVVFVPKGDLAEKYNAGDYVIVPLPLAQNLLHQPGRVTSVFVVAKPGADLNALSTDLVRVVDHRAVVAEPQFRVAQTDNSVSLTRDTLLLVGSIALVVAMFIVFNTMNMAVVQRRPMIATLRALGAKRGDLARDLLAEVTLLGLLGGLLGAPLGAAMSYLAIKRLPPLMLQSVDVKPDYFFPGSAIAVVVALGVVACVLGAAWPAMMVFRASPIAAMRPVELESLGDDRTKPHRAGVAVGVLLMALAFFTATRLHDEKTFAAGILVLAGILTLCWALGPTLVVLGSRIAALMGPSGQVSRSTMTASAKRTWANLMIVTIAVALGSVTSGVLTDVVDSTGGFFSSLAGADMYLSAASKDVVPISPLIPHGTDGEVRAIPGVVAVKPVQYAYVNVGSDRVLVVGSDPGTVTPAFAAMDKSVRAQVEAGDGVVISRQLSRHLHRGVGDKLTLSTPSGEQAVPILGVVDYLTTERGMIAMSLDHMKSWFQRDGATYLEVHVDNPKNAPAILNQLEKIAAARGLYAFSGQDAVDSGKGAVAQIGSLAVFVQWIVALLAAMALFNAFMISVIERTREIGVLRAMGASRRYVTKSILVEATSIALLGGVLGMLTSVVVHRLGTLIMSSVTAITVRYSFSPLDLLTVLVAVILCWSGALLPASRAAKSTIVDALEVE